MKSVMVSFKFSPEEVEMLRADADRIGMSMSGYVRYLIRERHMKLVRDDKKEKKHG